MPLTVEDRLEVSSNRVTGFFQRGAVAAAGIGARFNPGSCLPVLLTDNFSDIWYTHQVILSSGADGDNFLGLNDLIACAAFRVEEAKQFFERVSVGRIPEERPCTAYFY
jgi:hypothetical protein